MEFLFDNDHEILESHTIFCTDAPIVLACLHTREIEPIDSRPMLAFDVKSGNGQIKPYYLLARNLNDGFTEEEFRDCLLKILGVIIDKLKKESPYDSVVTF